MSGAVWWAVEVLTRSLADEEREAVLGDLQESQSAGFPALLGVMGLVLRRQVQTWRSWRPYLALFGIALPMAFLLADFARILARTSELYLWIASNYAVMDPDVLEETGFTLWRGSLICGTHLLLLAIWSWTGGFALAAISGLAFWGNAAVVCAVWCLHARLLEPNAGMLLLWISFLLGARRGMQPGVIPRSTAVLLAVCAVALSAVAIYSAGLWHAGYSVRQQLAMALLLSWPACYMARTSHAFRKPVLH
ncbi:MAG: hypothetical protein JST93_12725 [Acidobacteria bacterium]|nr:hypothetical protein [Acidobacteriota bacterium]